MCDDFTAVADDATLAKRGLSRRDFAAISAAAMGTLTVSTACAAQGNGPALTESTVTITTPDGKMDAFFVHPAEGKHPAVIMYPDIAGLRDAYKVMARTLAASGYAVVAVNHYYRSAKAPVMNTISEFFAPEGREKLGPMMAKLTVPAIVSDAKAIVAWLDANPAVDASKKIAAEGYCMTGSYAVRTAAAVPDRVGAVSSFHGGGLVTPAPDSPHKMLKGTKALYLFAIAQNDDKRSPDDKVALRHAAEDAGVGARVEVFAADHGWCTVDSAAYEQVEAERARTLSLWNYGKMG
ncbi:dienelactone hydrolase [Erythrobacter sp. SG61-1L]|uniref:dienelactone hydrolase family protein n=1 Tax=Erythrobacter sp. SG61-1L TaxID=1603897 RepID=UPI0006C930B2|nr:dienelactone hydrolase family protein [Erythrobacter sp. SG61-1L]KPL68815.1 dienelactone hydrolase [Erythrobacter sp. SG61-1L]